MTLDEMQEQWLTQNRRIDELLQFNNRLQLERMSAAPRAHLLWSLAGDAFEILIGLVCLGWIGSFIHANLHDARFWLPAGIIHIWLIATVATAIFRCVRTASVRIDASVLDMQRKIEELQVMSLRSLRALFLTGMIVWTTPFAIVAARSWLGLDLYALLGGEALIFLSVASVVGAFAALGLCAFGARQLDRSPRLQRVLRELAGYNLGVAHEQLAKLSAFERGQPETIS